MLIITYGDMNHEPELTVVNRNIIIFYDKIIPAGRYIEMQ